jgi:hypothetical protein
VGPRAPELPVSRGGRDGGGGRWLFFRFLMAPTPGRQPATIWGGSSGSRMLASSGSGGGQSNTHTTAERLAAIPGPRVRVDPSSAVSSTTCNPSPRPPLPRRPQRETPSIRAKCRQSASHRTRGHAADLGRFGDPLGIRLLTCGVWLRYIVDWRESDGARSAPRTFDQGPARRGVSLFRGADSGLHAGEQARYSQVIDRYGYTGPGVTSKGSTVCVPLVQ